MKFIIFLFSIVSANYVGKVFRCGIAFNNDICPQHLGCSQYGYCGNTDAYTKEGCQSNCFKAVTTTKKIVTTKSKSTTTSTTTNSVPTQLPSIFRDSCNKQGTISLSFDDGPSEYTFDFINYLSKNNIPATFFLIGDQIDTYLSTIQQMSRLGFEIGCHTWTHPDLTTLTDQQIRDELSETNNLIKKVTGKFPRYFRAPYLAYDSRVEAIVREFNMITVFPNLDTNDWKYQSTTPDLIYEAYLNTLPFPYDKGYITLQHDRYKPSLDLVPNIIDYIHSQNFTIVTMNECLN
jgi:peptidoglycan/xylan/chitin deacetylase (PgdA/CDA1 family)